MATEKSLVRGLLRRVITIRHFGPGPHPGTGTDQSVHGGGDVTVAEEATPEGVGHAPPGFQESDYGESHGVTWIWTPNGISGWGWSEKQRPRQPGELTFDYYRRAGITLSKRPAGYRIILSHGRTSDEEDARQVYPTIDEAKQAGAAWVLHGTLVERGGEGSGHFGHEGRPGEVGGSLPSGEIAEEVRPNGEGRREYSLAPRIGPDAAHRLRRELAGEWRRLTGRLQVAQGGLETSRVLREWIRDSGGFESVTVGKWDWLGSGEVKGGWLIFSDADGQVAVAMQDDPVEILVRNIEARPQRTGMGTRVMRALADYAEMRGADLTVYAVATPAFFSRFTGWTKVDGTSYTRELPEAYEQNNEDLTALYDAEERLLQTRGGPGSGHFGHEGRPGEVGGSEPGDQATVIPEDIAQVVTIHPEDIAGGKVTISPEDALLGQPIQRIENTVYGTGYTTEDYLQLAQHVLDEQPEAFREFVAQVEQALDEGTSTMDAYYDPETGEWTPERQALHDQIINDILEPGRPAPAGIEPEAVIMGGLPGSGKSSVLAERAGGGQFDGYVHIDADVIKGMLPEYEGWNAALLHDESSAIADEVVRRSIRNHMPIMYDATLRTTRNAAAVVDALESVGYNTRLIYVDIPIEESMRRVLSRFASGTGRYVSPFYVATHDGRNLLSLEALKGQVDAWEHWDNGQPRGQSPRLVAQGNRRPS